MNSNDTNKDAAIDGDSRTLAAFKSGELSRQGEIDALTAELTVLRAERSWVRIEAKVTASMMLDEVIEMDEITSSDGVTVRPGDKIEMSDGEIRDVYWVGIHKPSYLDLIGVQPQLEKGAVLFRCIKGRAPEEKQDD